MYILSSILLYGYIWRCKISLRSNDGYCQRNFLPSPYLTSAAVEITDLILQFGCISGQKLTHNTSRIGFGFIRVNLLLILLLLNYISRFRLNSSPNVEDLGRSRMFNLPESRGNFVNILDYIKDCWEVVSGAAKLMQYFLPHVFPTRNRRCLLHLLLCFRLAHLDLVNYSDHISWMLLQD